MQAMAELYLNLCAFGGIPPLGGPRVAGVHKQQVRRWGSRAPCQHAFHAKQARVAWGMAPLKPANASCSSD